MSLRTIKILYAYKQSKFLGNLRSFQILSQLHLPFLTFTPFYSSISWCLCLECPLFFFCAYETPCAFPARLNSRATISMKPYIFLSIDFTHCSQAYQTQLE